MPVTTAGVNFSLNVQNNQSLGSFGGGTPFPDTFTKLFQFALGNLAGQFNQAYTKDRTVTAATPDVINLTSGAIFQPDGVTAATFADVLALGFYNGGAAGQNLQIGGGTNALQGILGAAGVQTVLPGMLSFIGGNIAQGYPITDTLTIGGGATGGTFPLAVTALGSTQTATITYTATLAASAIQSALQALSNVGASNAIVTGANGGPWVINFTPAVGPFTMTTNATSLTGGTPTAALVLQNVINVNVAAGTNVPYQVMIIGH